MRHSLITLHRLLLLAAAFALAVVAPAGIAADWKPEKAIGLVVGSAESGPLESQLKELGDAR